MSCQAGRFVMAPRTAELMFAITSKPPLPSFEGFPYYCNTVSRRFKRRATRSRTRIWSLPCGSSVGSHDAAAAAAALADERKDEQV